MRYQDVDFEKMNARYQALEAMPREEAFAEAERILSPLDLIQGMEEMTEDQYYVSCWVESLYTDGEIGYRKMWQLHGKWKEDR